MTIGKDEMDAIEPAVLGYDDTEGIFFDRSKPIMQGSDCPERGPLYEECDPIEVAAEMADEIARLRARVAELLDIGSSRRGRLRVTNREIERLRARVEELKRLADLEDRDLRILLDKSQERIAALEAENHMLREQVADREQDLRLATERDDG